MRKISENIKGYLRQWVTMAFMIARNNQKNVINPIKKSLRETKNEKTNVAETINKLMAK